MPPQISPTPQRSDISEGTSEGGFFSQKIGPIPMWGVIAGGAVVLFVLYQKFIAKGSPAVTTNPSTDTTTGTPFDNFGAALAQIQNNEAQISDLIGRNNPGASSTTNNTPPAAQTSYQVRAAFTPAYAAPTASPISNSAETLRLAARVSNPTQTIASMAPIGGPNISTRRTYVSPQPIIKPTIIPSTTGAPVSPPITGKFQPF